MFLVSKNNSPPVKPNAAKKVRCVICLLAWLSSTDASANQNIAFYYGKPVPIDLLANFNQVVVEPDNANNIDQLLAHGVDVFAYVSVGEIHPSRPWFSNIPKQWLRGENSAWASHVVDLSQTAWHDFLIDKLMAPLWEQGYRGFFLDTLDSYQLATTDIKQRSTQQQALVSLIKAMHSRFPGVKLILNRGFDLLPEISGYIYAVAAESLYQGWNATSKTYTEVTGSDRDWLLSMLNQAHNDYGLPIIAIDYVAPNRRDLAREVAGKIKSLGFTPWVANPAMDMMGVGGLEVFPKRILALNDGSGKAGGFWESTLFKVLVKILGYFGYTVEYLDVQKELPLSCLVGQYVGIVTRFSNNPGLQSGQTKAWLQRQRDDGMKILAL